LLHCGLAQVDYASNPQETEREVGIVLPVGCGKSGTITLATANRADLDDAHVVITIHCKARPIGGRKHCQPITSI
jgi:hypothetical protein